MFGVKREKRRVTRYVAIVVSLALLTAACAAEGGTDTTGAPDDGSTTTAAVGISTTAAGDTSTTAGGTAPADDESGPIRIGSVFGLTGAYSGTDKDSAASLSATVAEINDQGGILGREVEFQIIDSQSDPARAALAAQFIVDDYQPHVMIPDIVCLLALSALPVAAEAEIVTFTGCDPGGPGDPSDPEAYPYNFSTFAPVSVQGEPLVAAAEYVMGDEPMTLGFLYSDDTAGAGTVDSIQAAVEAGGHTWAGAEPHEVGSPDKTVQLQRLRQAGANVVVLFGQVGDAGHTMRGVRDLNWTDVQVVGNTGVTSAALVEEIPEEYKDSFHAMVTANSIRTSDEDIPEWIDTYLRDASKNVQTLSVVGAVHDGITLWKWAVERAGTTDKDAVVAELEQLHELSADEIPQNLQLADNHMYSPTLHGMASADLTNAWGLMEPSENIMGTYLGVLYSCERC